LDKAVYPQLSNLSIINHYLSFSTSFKENLKNYRVSVQNQNEHNCDITLVDGIYTSSSVRNLHNDLQYSLLELKFGSMKLNWKTQIGTQIGSIVYFGIILKYNNKWNNGQQLTTTTADYDYLKTASPCLTPSTDSYYLILQPITTGASINENKQDYKRQLMKRIIRPNNILSNNQPDESFKIYNWFSQFYLLLQSLTCSQQISNCREENILF
jgi:hypothetical protein